MACALHAPAGAPRAQGMRARAASLAGRQSGFLGAGIPVATRSSEGTCMARTRRPLRPRALDAAQPFDFEARMAKKVAQQKKLRIGIVGFGNFGQFIAKRMVAAGHEVIATSRTPYYEQAKSVGATFYSDPDDFCEEHPHVVILCCSIISADKVLRSLPLQRLRRSTLFVDVLSVKVFPKQLLLKELPAEFDVLCTHPMFGPESGKGSWQNLAFVFDRVRVGAERRRQERLEAFLDFWRAEGCRMVEMTCEEHDRQAASTQFITHTVGRVLGSMNIQATQINTKGFESLLTLRDNTANDSFDLYYGLFMYNPNATEELERLERAFDAVKKALFHRLHDLARSQLFYAEGGNMGAAPPAPSMLLPAGLAEEDSSGSDGDDAEAEVTEASEMGNGVGKMAAR